MQRFDFRVETSTALDRYGSQGVRSCRIARLSGGAQAVFLFISPGGRVGGHKAVVRQLFIVMGGAGWVSGMDSNPAPISMGEAAAWDAGEWHASGTDSGMSVLVIESEGMEIQGAGQT